MAVPGKELQFKVHGLDCAEEVSVLRRDVGPIVGGEDRLAFDVLNGKMTVLTPATSLAPEAVLDAIARTGMRGELLAEGKEVAPLSVWQTWERTVLTSVAALFLLIGALLSVTVGGWEALTEKNEAAVPIAAKVFYALAVLAGVWMVLPKAWASLRRLRPDMNLLMTLAVIGAVSINKWLEAATVAFLFALSLALEAWSVGRARRAVAALMDLSPTTVHLLGDGGEREAKPEEVAIGARFVVRPGERFPLDGRVAAGTSAVNQAPVTGESVPVTKQPGDTVFAGTVNGEGALEVESTKAAGDTTLAHIVRLVSEAHTRRAPVEQWVDFFAVVYTPTVTLLAIMLAIVPPLLWGNWGEWFYRALALLVIACPCALVISTPVSVVAALAAAAHNGVLVKGGVFVELPSRLQAFVFDKTGTLTEGRPSVAEIVPLHGHDAREVIDRAAGLEARSEHPLAQAIVEHARGQGIIIRPADDLRAVPGKGATGRWDGRAFWVGSPRYMEERGQGSDEDRQRLKSLAEQGRSVVVVGNDEHVCGLIALADTVRPQAAQAMRELRDAGVVHLAMLTGDNEATAQAVARVVGLDEVRAGLLPQDKVAAVEELVTRYGKVAMVGDGVNDAPALARATIGVAMGAAGTDAAIETADVALMSDDLTRLAWLVRHSRRTMAVIRQNVIFSLSVKALFLALAVRGYSPLWLAILADTGASLAVVANGLRLLRAK